MEEDRLFEKRISTILFIAALEDAKDPMTAQILKKRRNEKPTKAAPPLKIELCVINSAKSTKERLTRTAQRARKHEGPDEQMS